MRLLRRLSSALVSNAESQVSRLSIPKIIFAALSLLQLKAAIRVWTPYHPGMHMRKIRVISLPVIAIASLMIARDYSAETSVTALVNAPLTTIRSPIEGTLQLKKAALGTFVSRGEPLGEIEDRRADLTRLKDLERAKTDITAELKKTEEELAALRKAESEFAQSASQYKQGRIHQLEAKLAEARALAGAAGARLIEAQSVFQRASNLSERGIQTVANLDRARSAYEVAKSDLEAARQRVFFLEIELEAAKNDTYLGDSYNDAAFSGQRSRDLRLRIVEQEGLLAHLNRRLAGLEPYLDIERARFSNLRKASVPSPAQGLIWDLPAKSGETVRKGQDLVRVVDCDARLIMAGVSERLYNRLRAGSPATFRVLGSSRVYLANIVRLAGPASPAHYDSLAVSPQSRQLSYFDVFLYSKELNEESKQECGIGQSGTVAFSAEPASFAASFGNLVPVLW